jgi:hypothetical protein
MNGQIRRTTATFLIWLPPWWLSVEAWLGSAATTLARDRAMSIDLHAVKIEDGDGDHPVTTDEYGDEAAAARR